MEATELFGWTEGADVMTSAVSRPRIDVISGVVYAQIKGLRAVRQLHMTLEIPRTAGKKPAVVYFPGGGFLSSDHEKYSEMRRALAERGFVVAACEYRTVPARFPAPVIDARAAVRFLRAHAELYGIDSSRIAAMGDSAGGWVVQMLGTSQGDSAFDEGDWLEESSDVQAVVTLYGISDIRSIGDGLEEMEGSMQHASPASPEALLLHGPAFKNMTGGLVEDDPELAAQASPIARAKTGMPPFLIFHGAQDRLVSPLQSAKLYERLKALGNDAEYVLVPNAAHADLPWHQAPVINRTVNWLSRKLGGTAAGEPL